MDSTGFDLPISGTTYSCAIEGNLGRFTTSAGEVIFLQTKARLSSPESQDISNAARLISLLIPAREALDVKEMDFNQLLQRDLDDHRIAHELVPYILKPHETGPAFFPPILAALLPFQNRRPKIELPLIEVKHCQEDPLFPGAKWKMSSVGDVFRLQELSDASGTLDPKGMSILRWNDELSKLVIMDGQHRAMALLAVYRTISNSWGSSASSGERYRSFYEYKIREIISDIKSNGECLNVLKLEFPVTICIFPEYTGPGKNSHLAARKLFVDVNKEAKPPSESRLILLSDTRLDHVLAREMLNHLRSNCTNNYMPLFAVEYDNPEPRTSTPRRWSAVTNLEILLRSVDYCCFGPEEVVSNIDRLTVVKGKPNKRVKSGYFRSQLRLQDFLDATICDGPRSLERHEIGLEDFPIYNQQARKALLDCFFDSWGKGLLRLFSEVEPYKAHICAIKTMHSGWLGGNIAGDLAKEALFEGVGMYWTLERGYEHWRDQVRLAKPLNLPEPAETEVSKAWRIVDDVKRTEFEKTRCSAYLGKCDPDSVVASKQFYSVVITYAAQVGLALTWGMLRQKNPSLNPDDLVTVVVNSINRSLSTGPVQTRDRKLFFRKEEKHPFNLLPKLDAPFAAYFRVFWFELIMMEHNHEELKNAGIDIDGARDLLKDGRRFYVNKIIEDHIQLHNKMDNTTTQESVVKGKESAISALSRAYHKWFGIQSDQARAMLIDIISNVENEQDILEEPDDELIEI